MFPDELLKENAKTNHRAASVTFVQSGVHRVYVKDCKRHSAVGLAGTYSHVQLT